MAALTAHTPKLIAFDCNLSPATITALLRAASQRNIPVLCDPTSVPKLARILPALRAHPRALTHLAPNTLELSTLHQSLLESHSDEDADEGWEYVNALNLGAEWRAGVDSLARRHGAWIADEGVVARMVQCLPWVGGFWLKAGEKGLLRLGFGDKPAKGGVSHKVASGAEAGRWLNLTWYAPPSIRPEEVVSTTGAGDTLVGGIVAGLVSGEAEEVFVPKAVERVGRTLRSPLAVV